MMLKNLRDMHLKLVQKELLKKKTIGATGYLIGNKIVDKITKISRTLPQNNSETITNEHDQEIPKERYIYLRKKDKKLLMI